MGRYGASNKRPPLTVWTIGNCKSLAESSQGAIKSPPEQPAPTAYEKAEEIKCTLRSSLCSLFYRRLLWHKAQTASYAPEVEALHAKWFEAFDSGDGATMDQMEMDNLALVMPVGFIWSKTEARAGKQAKLDPQTERTLSDVSVRRFGDTAVLTGILTSKSAKENEREATTVVFVQSSGKWKIASAQWTPVAPAK